MCVRVCHIYVRGCSYMCVKGDPFKMRMGEMLSDRQPSDRQTG